MERVGHRGDPCHAPENTVASVEMAWRHGFRAVECDVRVSRDGVPVVMHDATLARTTNGRGVVARQPWAALRALDAGRWFHERCSGEPLASGLWRGVRSPQPLASLADLLAACRRRALTVFLDLKGAGMEQRVHQVVCAAGMARRCRVASPSLRALEVFHRLTPVLSRYQLTGMRRPVTPRLIAQALRLGITGFLTYRRWVSPALVRRLAAERLELYVWTVRRRRDEQRFAAMGVTGVMTEWCPQGVGRR